MASLFRLLILAPIGVMIVLLAIANRAPVQISFDPVSADGAYTFTVPLFVGLIGALMVGIVFGGIAVWLGQGKHRRAARLAQRDANDARAEVNRLKAMIPPAAQIEGSSSLPSTMIR